jgi:hypothetical protein
MSQLILDDQLNLRKVLAPLQSWITVERLQDLRPGEVILDDRVPEILRAQKQVTFVTIDQDFWDRRWTDPNYAILYFALRNDQQEDLPAMLRALLRRSEFRTRAKRMGKVARVSNPTIEWWQFPRAGLQQVAWQRGARKG